MMPGNRAVMYAVLDSKPRAMIKTVHIPYVNGCLITSHCSPFFVLPCIVRSDGEAVYEKNGPGGRFFCVIWLLG